MFPPEALKTVAVYHLPTTAGQKQPYPGTADLTTSGAFLPMDRYSHTLEGGDLTNPSELYVDQTADIRVGDKIVIDSTAYYVRSIFPGTIGGLAHKRCSISTEP